MNNTQRVNTFIGATAAAAAGSSVYAGLASHTLHPYYGLAVLALTAATSRMKVKLPGIDGNMSVNLPFLLMAAINLSAVEAIFIACVSTMVQCWPKRDAKFKPAQMLFNASMMGSASSMAAFLVHAQWTSGPSMLVLATVALFLGQTVPVASVVTLSEGGNVLQVWRNIAQLSLPYYVVSAGVTSMMQSVSHRMNWEVALAVFPVMYGIHRSYRLYFGRVEEAPRTVALARAAGAGV
jgi:hypothetical protein